MENNYCWKVFQNSPGCFLLLLPDPPLFTIAEVTDSYLEATFTSRSIIGKGIFEIFPDNPDDVNATGVKNLQASLSEVITTKKQHVLPAQKYNVQNPQSSLFELKYWKVLNVPVINSDGDLVYIIHSVVDVTREMLMEINERLAKEETHRLNEEKAMLLDSITDGFLVVNQEGYITFCNKAAGNILQRPKEEISDHFFYELFPYLGQNHIQESVQTSIQSFIHNSYEYYDEHLKKWLRIIIYPSLNSVLVYFLDITILKNSERRCKSIIEHSYDGLAIVSKEGKVMDISESALKILGYEGSNSADVNFFRSIHAHDLIRVLRTFLMAVKTPGKSNVIQFQIRKRQGEFIWMECVFTNLIAEPTVQAMVLNFRDVTERIAQEQLLKSSEEKYRSLFQNNPAAIIVWSLPDLKPLEVNNTALIIYQYDLEQFKQLDLLHFRPLDDHARILKLLEDLKVRNSINSGTRKHIRKDGSIIYMNTHFYKIKYNKTDALLAISNDVTELVQLEVKLEREKKERQIEITQAVITAQENERAVLAKELHDNINQILSTTRLYIEHTLQKKIFSEQLLENSRDYLTKAIDEIRQLSKNLLPPFLEENNLKDAVKEITDHISKLSGITFHLQLDHIDHVLNNEAFKISLFRIIQEQINNIVKHSKASNAWISLIPLKDELKLEIKDDGIGCNMSVKKRGVGLKNIFSRSEIYGGEVTLDSEPGKGFLISIRYPIDNMRKTMIETTQ